MSESIKCFTCNHETESNSFPQTVYLCDECKIGIHKVLKTEREIILNNYLLNLNFPRWLKERIESGSLLELMNAIIYKKRED